MSGPIIRKYGFPNFEKIFGERPLEHGAEEPKDEDTTADRSAQAENATGQPTGSKPDARDAHKA